MKKEFDELYVIQKMCDWIGVNRKDVDLMETGWYQKHTWTREQERAFMEWLVEYIQQTTNHNKKRSYQLAAFILLGIGWKTQDNE